MMRRRKCKSVMAPANGLNPGADEQNADDDATDRLTVQVDRAPGWECEREADHGQTREDHEPSGQRE